MSLPPLSTLLTRSRSLCSRGALASTTLVLGVLLLSPFFAKAQPSPPDFPIGPTATPGPTPEPTKGAESHRTPTPTATERPAGIVPSPTTKKSAPTPSPTLRPVAKATPLPAKPKKIVNAVDASIRPLRQEEFVGEKVVNTTGVGQRVALSQIEGGKSRVAFVVRVHNTGNAAATYKVVAPAGGAGWMVHYFDAVKEGKEITSAVVSKTGWTTLPIAEGETRDIRLEVAPDTNHAGQPFRNLVVSVSSAVAPKVADAVVAGVGFQKVAGIEYSLDQGTHWKVAPLLSPLASSVGISVKEGVVVGLRAVPALPSLPWPIDPEFKPLWHDKGYWNMGQTIWVEAKGAPQLLSVECGNTVSTQLLVKTDLSKLYALDLNVTKLFVRVGGGEEGQTSLVLTVKDAKGASLPGVKVRFRAHYEDGQTAGTLGGDGPNHDLATTGSNGNATIPLTSGAREDTVIVEAQLVLDGVSDKEQPRAEPQMVSFFDVHPQPTMGDDF